MIPIKIDSAWRGTSDCRNCGIRDMVLFADLNEQDFAEVHTPIDDMVFAADAPLYTEGQQALGVFTLRKGMLKLVRTTADGRERIVRVLRPGDVAGLEALATARYDTEAVALVEASVCRIPLSVLHHLSANSPRLHKRLMQKNQDAEFLHASAESVPLQELERPLTRPADSMNRQKVLQVRGLSKQFAGIRALNQVDLDLYQGEILGLLGPNGSGKSTFINVVTGHYKPTEGTVLLQGQSCAGWPAHRIRRQGLSRTYQIPRPFHGLTVLQNVILAAHYGGTRLSDAQAKQEALEWMRFTGLHDKGDYFPDELNLHQRKFLELARALAARPQVLLLDEVLSGLTPFEIIAAVQTIRRIRDRGTSIVFVEHVMSAVLALSDRLVVLNQGEVIAEGSPEDVMSREEVVRAYLGDEAAV